MMRTCPTRGSKMRTERRLYQNSVVYALNVTDTKVIYQTHASRGYACYEMPRAQWDDLPQPHSLSSPSES